MASNAVDGRPVRAEPIDEGRVLRIVLDRPKGNVLTGAMMRDLIEVLDEHRDDRSLRLVTLRGSGGHFSFGASVEEHRKDAAPAMLATFHALSRRLARYPVPVAALVEGKCLGGAFELVLCCTFVFCAPNARLGCPEIKLGVFPPVLAALGPTRLGPAATTRLMVTGDELDAAAAIQLGLALPLPEQDPEGALMAWYRAKLRPLSARAIRTTVSASRVVDETDDPLGRRLDLLEKQYLTDVLQSHDGPEGIDAFLERRAPRWSDA